MDQDPAHNLGFDPDALRRKYLQERDKRLRDDRSEQYVGIEGRLAAYGDDPYVEPGFDRAPIVEEADVVVLGGGISGLVAGARLREVGVRDIRIIEKAGDFGGTWYWNRYPGAACDVEAYIYLPMLEEVGGMPTEKYARGPEILEHCRAIGRYFDLYESALFQTRLTEIRWEDGIGRWIVKTDRHDEIRARFVCLGSGPLSRPKLPGIPGISEFKGHAFHTSRWDYGYTGGGPEGNLDRLADKRVAVIGTGATAIQCVPHLAASAKQLYVFQRTPASVDVRANRPTDADWWKTLAPGWQLRRMRNFDSIIAGIPQDEDLVADSWTDIWRNLTVWAKPEDGAEMDRAALMQLADFRKMEQIRARVSATVKDPATAELLKPYYNQFCKRPCYHDEYLDAFNRQNVTLIDTDGKGVERITENAVVVDGQAYEVDCIIFATGFEVGAPSYRAGAFELIGRNGTRLSNKWADGVRSLHGMYSRDFPNLFVIGGIHQAAVTINFTFILSEQARHAAAMIGYCLENGIQTIEPTAEAEEKWAQTLRERSVFRETFFRECTPSYINKEGEVSNSLFANIYGGGPFEYIELLDNWRRSGMVHDMNIHPPVDA